MGERHGDGFVAGLVFVLLGAAYLARAAGWMNLDAAYIGSFVLIAVGVAVIGASLRRRVS